MLFENGALPNLKHAPNDELVFLAELPPLGYASYIVSHRVKSAGQGAVGAAESIVKKWRQGAAWNSSGDQTVVLGNGALTLTLSASTGSIVGLQDRWVAACASQVAEGAPEPPTGAVHDACMPLQQTDLYWAGMVQCGGMIAGTARLWRWTWWVAGTTVATPTAPAPRALRLGHTSSARTASSQPVGHSLSPPSRGLCSQRSDRWARP